MAEALPRYTPGSGNPLLALGQIAEPQPADAWNPIWDMILKDAGGLPPRKAPQYAAPRHEPVLPSSEFWETHVTKDPDWIRRQGQGQAAILSGLNALGFGVPMAAARRFAPETAAKLDAVMQQNWGSSTAAEIGATLANPANGVLRGAGDALARRGHNVWAQGAADGLTAAGVYSLPNAVRWGEPLDSHATQMGPVAAASRVLMPTLPASLTERALKGLYAGFLTGVPSAALGSGTGVELPAMMALGGMHGLSVKAPKAAPRQTQDQWSLKDARDLLVPTTAGTGGAAMLARLGGAGLNGRDEPVLPGGVGREPY